ncbi:hypothetical protein V497_02777 [Pseudogymnoascus sp. VKM F-4516 (FW-969)]|nr:hypothetical protein V497_02777 [Pseudogymnoascus sp. VKM F-4516 (FW-969)]
MITTSPLADATSQSDGELTLQSSASQPAAPGPAPAPAPGRRRSARARRRRYAQLEQPPRARRIAFPGD